MRMGGVDWWLGEEKWMEWERGMDRDGMEWEREWWETGEMLVHLLPHNLQCNSVFSSLKKG